MATVVQRAADGHRGSENALRTEDRNVHEYFRDNNSGSAPHSLLNSSFIY